MVVSWSFLGVVVAVAVVAVVAGVGVGGGGWVSGCVGCVRGCVGGRLRVALLALLLLTVVAGVG